VEVRCRVGLCETDCDTDKVAEREGAVERVTDALLDAVDVFVVVSRALDVRVLDTV